MFIHEIIVKYPAEMERKLNTRVTAHYFYERKIRLLIVFFYDMLEIPHWLVAVYSKQKINFFHFFAPRQTNVPLQSFRLGR